ncbi:MAG: hypothetical protein WDN49_24380 [Acetobacteraceae bacterium]
MPQNISLPPPRKLASQAIDDRDDLGRHRLGDGPFEVGGPVHHSHEAVGFVHCTSPR